MRGRLSHLRRGAVAPMAALMMTALLGFTGLAVDVGRLHLERRALQAAVDAAALSSARAPAQAQALAASAMTRQGYAAATRTVVAGVYTDDQALSPAARFVAGGTEQNAVRVTARTQLPLALSRVLTGRSAVEVTATATAAHRPLAAFSVGSQTLGLNGGVVNLLLSALLGGNVDLNVISYQGLADARIGLLEFLNQLAVEVGLTAGTYSDLLNASVGLGTLLDVAANVLASTRPDAAVSVDLLSQAVMGGHGLTIGKLLGLDFSQTTQIGQYGADQSYTNLDLNVLNLVQSAIQLGGNQSVLVPLGVNIPGLAEVGLQLRIIQPPQGLPGNALGAVGSVAWTSQIRLLLTVRLLSVLTGLEGGVINVPVIVDVAPAQAELRDISCEGEPGLDSTATIRATTGVARVQIADITQAQFQEPTTNLDALGDATIVDVLGLVRIKARAVATLGTGQSDLEFSMQDINNQTARSVSSTNLVGSLIGSLANSIELRVELLWGLIPLDLGQLTSGLLNLLRPVLAALDPLVDGLLQALGVRLGVADVRVSGIRCGVVALVN